MPEISVSAIFTALVPIAITIAVGYFFRRKNWVDQSVQAGLMRLVIWVFTPALIVNRVLDNSLLKDFSVAWKVVAAGFLSATLGMIIALLCARFFGINDAKRRRAFGYCCGVYNYGYIALPICMSLCPKETVGLMLLFNSSIDVAIWTVGVAIVNGCVRPADLAKSVVNPIFFSMILCLACNFTGISGHAPKWVFDAAGSLGACMIPIGILLVGMSLPVLMNGFRLCDEPAVSVGALIMRLLLIPALMTAAALFVPALPQDLRYVLIIQSGMPAAMISIVILQYYGGDARLALRVVLSTSVVCIATLPAWIKTGFWLLEKIR